MLISTLNEALQFVNIDETHNFDRPLISYFLNINGEHRANRPL